MPILRVKVRVRVSELGSADYLVLSGALGKPCTRVMYSYSYSQDYLAIVYSIGIVYLSCILPYLVLSNTVDQTVSTVLVQLGAARHLYLYWTSDR